jgi:peptidoglycan/LPS O-acetylase OafA/YrhL
MLSFLTVSSAGALMRADSPNLDALRSIAVLLVVFSHLPPVLALNGANFRAQAFGPLGVVIFFVHTCLVLLLSLERQSMRSGSSSRAVVFLVRRAFRIYPLSIVVVLSLSAILSATASSPPSVRTVVSNLLLIQNLTGDPSIPGPLWSLPFEVQMYLLLPMLYVFVERSGNEVAARRLTVLWAVSVALVVALAVARLDYTLVKYYPCFLPGVLAFSLRNKAKTLSPVWLFAFVAMVAALFSWMLAYNLREHAATMPVCLALGYLIPRSREPDVAWLAKAGKVIARYSYGIYLVHIPCIDLAFHRLGGQPAVVQWVVFVAGTAGLSLLAYHWIEKPCLVLGSRLSERVLVRDSRSLTASGG